jgi:hypothetical protein
VEGTDVLTMGGTRLMSLGDLLNMAFLSVNNPTFSEIIFMEFLLKYTFCKADYPYPYTLITFFLKQYLFSDPSVSYKVYSSLRTTD